MRTEPGPRSGKKERGENDREEGPRGKQTPGCHPGCICPCPLEDPVAPLTPARNEIRFLFLSVNLLALLGAPTYTLVLSHSTRPQKYK